MASRIRSDIEEGMSYTSGERAPKPTVSERAFANLSDEAREAMTERWLQRNELTPEDLEDTRHDVREARGGHTQARIPGP